MLEGPENSKACFLSTTRKKIECLNPLPNLSNTNFSILKFDKGAEDAIQIALHMSGLAYHLSKQYDDNKRNAVDPRGKEINLGKQKATVMKIIAGDRLMPGSKDEAGAIVLLDSNNNILVAFHGSITGNFLPVGDWAVNYKADPTEDGMHSGYAAKVQSMMPNIVDAVVEIAKEYTVNKVIFAGHSQGAALAQFAALFLAYRINEQDPRLLELFYPFLSASDNLTQEEISSMKQNDLQKMKKEETLHKLELQGKGMDPRNKVMSISFSTPPSFIPKGAAIKAFHNLIGPNNAISVNVWGDPVT